MKRRSTSVGLVLLLAATAVVAVGPPAAAAVTPAAQADAQAMVSSGRLTFGHSEPEAQILAYANGTERVNPATGRSCNINKTLLRALKTVIVDRGFSVRVTSLNRWCEGIDGGPYSFHSLDGGGHAVDVGSVNGVASTGVTSQDISYINAMAAVLPTPAGLGQFYCGAQNVSLPSGWVRFDDGCNHVHIEYRGADNPQTPPVASENERSYSLRTDGVLQGKESLYAGPVTVQTNVAAADADGETIATVLTNGDVMVKRGSFNSSDWIRLADNAEAVVVDGDRFVVLHTDGRVRAKDGLLSGSWQLLAQNIEEIDADNGRVGVRGTNGTVRVKDGGLTAGWVTVENNATDIALDGDRVGVVVNRTAKVKAGAVNAGWVVQGEADEVELSGDRIGVRYNGDVSVKSGGLNGQWVYVSDNTTEFAMSGSRISAVRDGTVRIKQGGLDAVWLDAFSNATRSYLG